ncbi:mevalonate kinase [Legionella busanensis]|uniref:Mevalonate kinase n=1 Tax=Legionella busanensis TaxID=190655 RepID=A0A378JIC4_9GAMM|nr:hypothetical protein [Legionella busanensis]STX50797.1 mevalonate kinase [Legionella busanensis]
MKWQIPAKTFLVGEYAALIQAPAIILTTKPCFELTLEIKEHSLVHPASPAGLFWLKYKKSLNQLHWFDPYKGCGGLGASSAQFIGAYLALCYLENKPLDGHDLLNAYYEHAWNGQGVKPSGYDIIAQAQRGCVYIDRLTKTIHCYDWVFKDISFILLHTGSKVATHCHLQEVKLPSRLTSLKSIVENAQLVFQQGDSHKLITVINSYQQELIALNLVAPTTLELLKFFKADPNILTVKGCGALGMDILLLIVARDKLVSIVNTLKKDWLVLATSEELYDGEKLFEIM